MRRAGDGAPAIVWSDGGGPVLPLREVRGALNEAALREPLAWVLKAMLETLVQLKGEAMGFKEGLSLEKMRACAQRFRLGSHPQDGRGSRAESRSGRLPDSAP